MKAIKQATQTRRPKIPSLESIKSGIDELLKVEKWDDYKIKRSPKRFEKRLNELFLDRLGILAYVIYLGNDKCLPPSFYRLRKQVPSFNEGLISEFSYPANHVVKTVQRANIPHHPVFYCSDDANTALRETVKDEKVDPHNVYYLSEWSFRENSDVRVCPYLFDNVSGDGPYKFLADLNIRELTKKMRMHTADEIAGVKEIMKFLSNLFIYEDTYVISSYIAHTNLYAPHNLRPDVFIYPSVRTKGASVNFAIHPNAVTEKMILKRVFKIVINSIDIRTGNFTVSILAVGHNNQGSISWTEVNSATAKGRGVINELDILFKKIK